MPSLLEQNHQTESVKQLSTHFNIFRLLPNQLLTGQAQSTKDDQVHSNHIEQAQSSDVDFDQAHLTDIDQVQLDDTDQSSQSASTNSHSQSNSDTEPTDIMSTVNKSTTHHRTSIGTGSSVSTADVTDQEIVKFVSHDGEHHTTVDESVFKVVTDEHIRTYQHEEITHALDKEIHEDHHYTVVQPIETTENLPDKHTHNLVSIEHRTIDQRNKQAIRDQLAAEAARFKNTTVTHEATRSSYTGPEITSEHVHHHIHEHIQPVLHKEVLAHEYIHTTIPVHETHHVEAQHHGTTILPSITLEEFRAKKGIWNGRKERRVSEYDGCPETYEKKLHEERAKLAEATMTAQVV